MKRTTVFLDEQTLLRLKRTAQREGVASAVLVREAIHRYLDAPPEPTGLPSIAGQFASGMDDTADRTDDLLWRDPHA